MGVWIHNDKVIRSGAMWERAGGGGPAPMPRLPNGVIARIGRDETTMMTTIELETTRSRVTLWDHPADFPSKSLMAAITLVAG